MLGPIGEFVKRYRHEVGKHVLVVGSGMLLPPYSKSPYEIIAHVALSQVGESDAVRAPDERLEDAIERWAASEPDHANRTRLVSEALADARPSEGHIRLARMIKDGYFSTLLWGPPDGLLEQALRQQRLEAERDFNLVVVGIADPEEVRLAIEESTRITVVKTGGDLAHEFLPLTARELKETLKPVARVLRDAMRPLLVFVAYSPRESELLALVPPDGDRMFWVNRIVPVESRERYDELRIEAPAAAKLHSYEPAVTALLARRGSSKNLLCREAGTFDEFFGRLHHRVQRRRGSGTEGRKDLTVLPGGPYRYLDYLDVGHGDLFFGRETETEELQKLILEHPFSVLCGPDGVGKSSLLRAGVAAAMVAQEKESDQRPALIPVVVKCTGDPADDTRRAVEATLHERGWLMGVELEADGFVEAIVQAVRVADTGLAVLVDGFEHCIVRRGLATRRGFAEVSRECAERLGERWRMCVAVREEFLGYLLDFRSYWPGLMSAVYRLGRLSQNDAVDAILKPGPAFHCYPEQELAERVAADLDDGGVLPAHLQIVMNRLYEQRSWGTSSITLKSYEHLGGAERILEECIDFPLSQLGQRDRRLARTILHRLVGSQHTTVPKSLERLTAETRLDRERLERVLARLLDLRMVRAVGGEGNRHYALIHPYLAEQLSTELSERLVAAAKHADAVARATDEWLHTGTLVPPRLLRRLRDCRDTMWFSTWELEALVRAAAIHEIDLEYWLRRVTSIGPERVPLLRRLLHDTDERIRRAGAEGLSQVADEDSLSTLVDGLHDRDEEVRERATLALESHERELTVSLTTDEPAKRQRAAHALGIIGREKHVGALVDALRDGDDEFTDQATRALSQVGPQRAESLLMQRLTDEPDAPWSVAYALGHLATDARTLDALEEARKRARPSALPKLDYAIGRARLTRGELGEAQRALESALAAVQDAGGRRAIESALAELNETRERAWDSDPLDWTMFGGGASRRAYRRRQIKLPLVRRWAFSTEDEVVASPVVASGMVYIGSRDRMLYCLDAGAGTLKWRLPAKDRIESTAAVAEGRVVVGSMDGTLYCVEAESGSRRWTFSAGSPIRASATIADSLTFVATRGGLLAALSLENGELVWDMQVEGDIVAGPAVRGGYLVFGAWDHLVRCLDPRSGEERWRFNTHGEISGAPAIAEGAVYCPSDAGFLFALDLDTGRERWRTAMEPPVRCSPAVTDEVVIAGDGSGRLVALAVCDGAEHWGTELGDEVSGSPAVAGDLVFVGSVDGSLRALDIRTGEEKWREKTAFGIYSSPAIAGEMVLVAMGYYDLWAFSHQPETLAPATDTRS